MNLQPSSSPPSGDSGTSPESHKASRDSLPSALEQFKEALQRGENVDPEEFCDTHVDCEPDLRKEIERRSAERNGGPAAIGKEPPASKEAPEAQTSATSGSQRTIGDFQILREIGRGGMGVVYEAEQISLNRRVALKVLGRRPGLIRDQLERFHREAKAGGRQRHPGIVAVYSVGEDEGVHYIVQELVEGGRTLSDRLDQEGKAKEPAKEYFREIAILMAKVADALGHAHVNGVIHRDVKSSNILLTGDGSPKITDFGLAKIENALALTRSGHFEGTPSYVSPEQVSNPRGGIDHRTDIYSLGVTLYEALTLVRPFQGDTSLEVLKKVLQEEPTDPADINPRVPRDLAVITLKAMEKEPGHRYATMADFAADLRRWLNGEAILARPSGPVTRGFKWVKRHRAMTAAALVAVSFALIFGVFSIARQLQRTRSFNTDLRQAEEAAEAGNWDDALDHLVGALSIKPNDPAARERRRFYLQQKELLAIQGERDEKAAALLRSEGMRLATESARRLERNPGLALILAIESSERYPGLVANNAMASALEVCRELRTIAYRRYPFVPEAQYLDVILQRTVDFGLGGGRLLTTCHDNTPRIWDGVTGEELVLLGGMDGRPGDVHPAAFGVSSPDGRRVAAAVRIAAGPGSSAACLFDAQTGAVVADLSTGGFIVDIAAFSPDGRFVAAGTREPAARVWDTRTGEPRAVCRGYEGDYTWGLGFSPDGSLLATASDDSTARIWNAATGEQLMVLEGHEHTVRDATFSPDGSVLATVSDDLTLRLWDPATGEPLRVVRTVGSSSISVREVVFSPDGSLVTAAFGDPIVHIWSVPGGDEVVQLRGHTASVRLVRFSPDGRRVATAGFDNTARLWDVATGDELAVFRGHEAFLHEVSFSPDGEKLATISEDGTVRIWDARTDPPKEDCVTGRVERLQFRETGTTHPGGARLEIQHDSNRAVLFPRADRGDSQGLILEHESAITGGRFSPDGKLLVTGSGLGWMGGGEARIFDAETGALLKVIQAKHGPLVGARFFEDNHRLALAWHQGPLEFRDSDSGEILVAFEGHAGSVRAIAYSHDLSRLATSSLDGTVRIWDVATGEPLTVFRGHEEPVFTAVFSPDGRYVVSSSRLGTLRLWRSDTGEELLTRVEAHDVSGGRLGFSPDGARVISISGSGAYHGWPVDVAAAAKQRKPRELTPAEKRAHAVWDPGEEEALQLVEQLFDEKVLARDVRASLQAADDLSEPVREAALRFAGLQEDNATMLEWAGRRVTGRFTELLGATHIRGDPGERGRKLLAAAKRLTELEARGAVP